MSNNERMQKTSWLKRIFSTDDSYEYEDMEEERLYPKEDDYAEASTEQSTNEPITSEWDDADQEETKASFESTFNEEFDDILMKDNQDKVVLDSVIALENLLKDRQLVLHGYKNIKEKLKNATEEINQAKNENEHQKVLINEKDRIIQKREQDIAEQQMIYDQLLEDYRLFKQNSQEELTSFTEELDRLNKNYQRLMSQSTKEQADYLSKITLFEEKIRTLEIENETYQTKYDQMHQEKNRLMEKVDHFTKQIDQMSLSFIDQHTTETNSEAEFDNQDGFSGDEPVDEVVNFNEQAERTETE